MIAQILIVDDDPVLRSTLRYFLESKHHRVLEAKDGAEGFQIAEKEVPHLIIMDVMMPGVYGSAATKRLQEYQRTSKIPIIVLSGVAAAKLIPLFPASPTIRFLSKPVDPVLLDQTIRELLPQGGYVP